MIVVFAAEWHKPILSVLPETSVECVGREASSTQQCTTATPDSQEMNNLSVLTILFVHTFIKYIVQFYSVLLLLFFKLFFVVYKICLVLNLFNFILKLNINVSFENWCS